MSLFDQIRGAIDNPNQQASSSQLGTILDTVQQLSSNHNTDSSTVQSAASIVGKYVRSSLQQKRESGGEQQAQEAINIAARVLAIKPFSRSLVIPKSSRFRKRWKKGQG